MRCGRTVGAAVYVSSSLPRLFEELMDDRLDTLGVCSDVSFAEIMDFLMELVSNV
jgi:hypothetical protein